MSQKKKRFETARRIKELDPAAKSMLEVILLYPGYHALGYYRVAHWFYNRNFFFISRLISQLGRFFTQVEIHPGAKIGRRLFIDHGGGTVIGETSVIGDDCIIYQGVTLGGTGHSEEHRHPILGDRVMIGAHALVLGPIKIGNDAKIGANATILSDVPEGTTAVGIYKK